MCDADADLTVTMASSTRPRSGAAQGLLVRPNFACGAGDNRSSVLSAGCGCSSCPTIVGRGAVQYPCQGTAQSGRCPYEAAASEQMDLQGNTRT